MEYSEKYGEKPEVCNIGAHHDEIEMTSLISPIIQVCDLSENKPGERQILDSYISRIKELEDTVIYPGVVKSYIQWKRIKSCS